MIVLDASLLMGWYFAERGGPIAAGIYETLPDMPIVVPAHWPLEIANALRTSLRMGRITPADFRVIIDQFDALHVRLDRPMELDEIGPLTIFADTHGLTTYDAAYLQLALRQNAILATLDADMRKAAGMLSIPLLPP